MNAVSFLNKPKMMSLNINIVCAITALMLPQIIQVLGENNVCGKENGTIICCSGFYDHDGRCLECFGAFGSDCSKPCSNITFGYRCKNTCYCHKHEICNKYLGCQTIYDINTECNNTLLLYVIGSGSVLLFLVLLFIGVMFYRWHKILQRNHKSADKTGGFEVDQFPITCIQDTSLENYDDIRESRMLLDDKIKSNRKTTENRMDSTDYNLLFCKESTPSTVMDEMGEQYYSAIDARFRGKSPLVTLSEFQEDDCYVSLSQNIMRNKRMSKSCSNITVDTPDVNTNVGFHQYFNSKVDKTNGNVLIAHL